MSHAGYRLSHVADHRLGHIVQVHNWLGNVVNASHGRSEGHRCGHHGCDGSGSDHGSGSHDRRHSSTGQSGTTTTVPQTSLKNDSSSSVTETSTVTDDDSSHGASER